MKEQELKIELFKQPSERGTRVAIFGITISLCICLAFLIGYSLVFKKLNFAAYIPLFLPIIMSAIFAMTKEKKWKALKPTDFLTITSEKIVIERQEQPISILWNDVKQLKTWTLPNEIIIITKNDEKKNIVLPFLCNHNFKTVENMLKSIKSEQRI